ncbi:hypothetical protein [Nitrosococcus watsonii]|uniref:hypothetical protein n=1 Tax=Nitrosococcus watsonii TaxID=473531 RepID=UPI0012FC8EC3|nr:hypothetical protein [Nitrosococcus watsonii]
MANYDFSIQNFSSPVDHALVLTKVAVCAPLVLALLAPPAYAGEYDQVKAHTGSMLLFLNLGFMSGGGMFSSVSHHHRDRFQFCVYKTLSVRQLRTLQDGSGFGDCNAQDPCHAHCFSAYCRKIVLLAIR